MDPKSELVTLLEERTRSHFERRRRRLQRIPLSVVPVALEKDRKGEPLTLQEYIASHLGFMPGELERLEQEAGDDRRANYGPGPNQS